MRLIWLTIVIVLLDQSSKLAVQALFSLGDSMPVVDGILHLTYHRNTGAAFGLFVGNTPALAALSLAFIAATGFYLSRKPADAKLRLALTLILAGAVGNAVDRIRLGYVVDFIDFRVWPIFNVADCAISCGAFLVLWRLAGLPARGARRP